MRAHPPDNVEAVHHRHLQIQKQQTREGIFRSIAILTFALQISQHLRPIGHNMDWVNETVLFESSERQLGMPRIVFSEQYQVTTHDEATLRVHPKRRNSGRDPGIARYHHDQKSTLKNRTSRRPTMSISRRSPQ